MKKLTKLHALLAGALLLLAACTEEVPLREPSPTVPENTAAVYFPAAKTTHWEIDPSSGISTIAVTIARQDSVGELTVPLIVGKNDDSVFQIPQSVTFADTKKTATIAVAFAGATEGKTYRFAISVQGDKVVNPYITATPAFESSLTLIKWEPMANKFIYLDGTFSTFFNTSYLPFYVEADKAVLGNVTRYRLKNPYHPNPATLSQDANGIYNRFPYTSVGEEVGSDNYYVVLEVDSKNSVSMAPADLGVDWTYGMFGIGSIYGNLSTNIGTYPLGTLQDDVIRFGANSLYITMANYQNGGAYPCPNPTSIYLSLEAYLKDNKKIDDFSKIEYNVVEAAESVFESGAFESRWNQKLYSAVDVDSENPESEYKNLFYLKDLYTEGHGLVFYYVESTGRITFATSPQNTGVKFAGKEIYIAPNSAKASSAREVTIGSSTVLQLTFEVQLMLADGTVLGAYTEKFYLSEEAILFSIDDFPGAYTMTGESPFEGGTNANMPVKIEKDGNVLVLRDVDLAGSGIRALFDETTSSMSIVPQPLDTVTLSVAGIPLVLDVTLYTMDENGNVSTTLPVELSLGLDGTISVKEGSPAIGYLLWTNEAGGGWLDGYYNLVFTPRAATQSRAVTAPTSLMFKEFMKKGVKAKPSKKLSTSHLKTQGKSSVRQLKGNIGPAL